MSRTRINSKWLSNCTGEELKQMNRLRFKGDSMMYTDVLLAPCRRDKIRVFFLKKEGKIIGWSSCITPLTVTEHAVARRMYPTSPGTTKAPVYTYVNSSYRKTGYGRRLLLTASRYAHKNGFSPIAFFWDEKSSRFFLGASKAYQPLEVFDITEWFDIFDYEQQLTS